MKAEPIQRLALLTTAATLTAFGQAQAAVTATDGQLSSDTASIERPGPGHVKQQTALGGIATDELPVIRQGVTEFGLSGFLDWDDDTDYALNLSYGYFVNDCWMLGVRLGTRGTNSDIDVSAGLFAEYNFHTGTKWVPFVGIGADWQRLDSDFADSDSIEMSGEFGVKYFMRANVAVTASMAGTWASDTLPDGNDFGSRINLGLRFYF